jgi:threonine synthase
MIPITLGEGNTPLLSAPRLAERYGIGELWLKWEGANPTGSFKDRGMAVATTRALERGITRLVCASTGNTAASSAAYAARAGIEAVGGQIVEIEGSFSDAFAHAEQLAAEPGSTFVNSGGSDDRIEGQMTVAAEIAEQLGGAPDIVTLPYGGGGNTRAVARGFEELVGTLPALYPVEAAQRPDTVASAIRITEPVHERWVHEAIERSGGSLITLTDEEILDAWRNLRTLEGVFSEPASAAGIAGLAHAKHDGRVVCIVTGHGLKDPAAVRS